MARTLLFVAEFTKSKVKTTPANAPTIDIADKLAPTGALLVTAGTPTQFTNLTGVYVYSYSAADTVDPVGVMRTADTTVDLQDIPCNPIPLSAKGFVKADTLTLNNTDLTARDIGASVLLSSGTGTGQLDFTSGVVKSNLAQILGTALTETAGQIAAAFVKFFNKATPTGTINSIPDAVAGATGGIAIVGSQMDLVNAPNSTAITAIQNGLATLSKLLKYTQLLARKDSAIATDNATELTAINANGGSGGGAYANTTDAQEALRDRGDTAYLTATGFAVAGDIPTATQNANAVLDVAASSHNTSGTIGAKINASGSTTAGAGAISYTPTIKDASGNPIDGAEVWVTTDAGGSNVIASGSTNALGVVNFMLDAGVYSMWVQASGHNFSNPTSFTVS